jgi:hypothetical protein
MEIVKKQFKNFVQKHVLNLTQFSNHLINLIVQLIYPNNQGLCKTWYVNFFQKWVDYLSWLESGPIISDSENKK